VESRPHRTPDIRTDPRFRGWWPRAHPQMRSFLGVPIVARDRVIGAFYLTEKESAAVFDDEDQALIELLAAHASIAITNARLYEQSRELTILSERNRLALELHDVVSQKLFSLNLAAETATTLLGRDPEQAAEQLRRVRELGREALNELRALIMGLRPADLERDIGLLVEPSQPLDAVDDRDAGMLRIAEEALHNAIRHAAAKRVTVTLSADQDETVLTVADDGVGFDPADPAVRSRRLGLTSMEERARELGGRLEVRSAAGAGTTVTLKVPPPAASRR
jgi:signal transduction histidine kinase